MGDTEKKNIFSLFQGRNEGQDRWFGEKNNNYMPGDI